MSSSRATLGPNSYYPSAAGPTDGNAGANMSVSEQIMQLDSAITSTLQEIDANFARAHQIVTAKLLPAVKIYGQHSAKAWQSAKFWQEFFIAAANVPVRRSEDAEDQGYDEANDQTYDPSSEASMNQQASPGYTDSQADHSNRSPLMRRGQAGDDSQQDDSTDSDRYLTAAKHARASSPPKLSNTSMKALSNRERKNEAANDSQASWAAIESPFERLKKEVEADYTAASAYTHNGGVDMSQAEARLAHHRANRLAREKALMESDPTLEVERKELADGIDKLDLKSSVRSPAKLRPNKSPPKLLNRVLNAEQKKADGRQQKTPRKGAANGVGKSTVADLRSTPLTTDKYRTNTGKAASKGGKGNDWNDDSEDSLAWPAGMSPPVTVQFSVPQSKYAKTPAKEAAKLLMDDLLRTAEVGPGTARKLREQRMMRNGVATAPEEVDSSPAAAVARKGKLPALTGQSMVSTPLKKGPLGRVKKGRDSMPTPPTLTMRGGFSATPAGAYSGIPGSAASATTSRLLLDEDEGGIDLMDVSELKAGPPTASARPRSHLDALLDASKGNKRAPAGSAAAAAADLSDEESDDDDDDSEDDDSADAVTASGQLTSQSKNLSTFSATSNSGWTSSSNSATGGGASGRNRTGAGAGGSSLDNDTLFGVGKSRVAAASTSGAGSGASSQFRVHGGQLDSTVQGGKLLEDKDVTYSAPSPTPWKQ